MSCNLSINNLSVTGDCSNTNSGAFSFEIGSSAPGYTITWVSPVLSPPTVIPAPYTFTQTGLSGGTYSFYITSSCLDPNPEILVLDIPISTGTCVSIDAVQNTTCSFDNGSLTASTSYYYDISQFYLYDVNNGYITSGESFTNTFSFNSLSAGTYYVVANDGGGCTGSSETCIIKSSTTFNYDLYVVDNAACLPSSSSGAVYVTNLSGTPPYTYYWYTTPVQTTSFITGLTSGSYQVKVTDFSGCENIQTAIVNTVPPLGLGAIYSTSPSCFSNDGQVQVVVTGGTAPFYFSASNGSSVITFSPSHTFNNVSPGPFQIQITDAGLCNIVVSTSLANPLGFSTAVITTTNSTCTNNDGIILISLVNLTSSQVIYTLTDSSSVSTTSNVTSSPTWNFAGLESDTYTLTISGGDCVFTTSVIVNNIPLIDTNNFVTGTTCGLCNGSVELTVSGGTGPYSYNITGKPTVTGAFSSYTFSDLCSGTYVGTITDTSNLCTSIENFLIPSSQNVSVSLAGTDPSSYSNNGTISAFITNGVPPFTWTWSSNVNGQTGLTLTNLSAGTYTFSLQDSEGCTINKKITLNGYTPVLSYQVYNICDSSFENTGVLLTKGPKQMLNEGFYDLTSGDTNCILNQSVFTAKVTVGEIIKTSTFYTGNTLNDYPSDEDFSEELENLISSYDGITGVTINIESNTIKITTPCNTLSGVTVKIDMLINYDISCEILGEEPPS